ncbi:Na+/H+ antiporter subunit E [Aquisalimonas lutea]|uniref:Na+/H+ antiporter subunit E n=1 Tax=Aquisalimonas lutea TaxID=1327750 RepID=UPI0025B2CD64|nr:Na+/H+ antiporter subunit E [Aquisalimonas lutea]MDN3519190.1 Na+/H+ antiporter subunit E [Aquisalimonas lutea]
MKMFIWNILLALVWAMLTGSFTAGSLVAGFIFGYLVLAFVARLSDQTTSYSRKIPEVIGFTFFYIWELIQSNLRVAYEVLTPSHHMKPGVIGLPLDATTDAQITMLANLITMTPGTLSLDVSNDRRMLFIHAMYIEDENALHAELKELERRVISLLS